MKADVAHVIDDGHSPLGYVDGFSHRVLAIDSGLEWELNPGATARHSLVVTSAGKPEVRATAARWLAAAPEPDEVWEYHDARQAHPDMLTSTLELGEVGVDLSEFQFAITVDQDRRVIDVVCHHPAFTRLDPAMHGQATFLALDWILGETWVESWLGEVTWTTQLPARRRAPEDLRHAVAAMSGDDQWSVLTGERPDGLPVMATVNLPVRPARWPRFDTHLTVSLPYRTANEGQFPVDDSLEALHAFEDRLIGVLGDDGALVAHESGAGRRILHFYLDAVARNQNAVTELARGWRYRKAVIETRHDPRMEGVAHLSP